MKRSVLSLLVVVLVIGGAGYAWGSARSAPEPPPTKPADLPGNEATVRTVEVGGTRAIGTQNPLTSREYVPLATPCRLYDSRAGGGALVAGAPARLIPRTACPGIPGTATALDASLSAVTPSGPGFLRAWAEEASEPSQTLLQWGTSGTTAGATVTVSADGILVRAYTNNTHLVVDVAGYYQQAIYANVLPSSATLFADMYSSSTMIAGYSSSLAEPGRILVSVRRNISLCDIEATTETPGYTAHAVQYDSTSVLVRVRDSAGNPARSYTSVLITC